MSATLDEIISRLRDLELAPVERSATKAGLARQVMARCPAHDDDSPSLSLAQTTHGKILLNCFAGCTAESVARALGLTLADLSPHDGQSEWTPRGPAVATYSYEDESGELLFQVCRTAKKEFPARRRNPSSKSGWTWNLNGVRRVPYRLPELIAAVKAGQVVYVAEGEKDVEAIEATGAVATCNPGGAGKWTSICSEFFRGARRVVVVADRDIPGLRHAHAVADALRPLVGEVAIVQAAEGKDAFDHLAAGKRIEEFVPIPDRPTSSEPSPQPGPRAVLPEIEVTADMYEVISKAEAALLSAQEVEIFQRMGSLVRVTRDEARRIKGLQRPPRSPVIAPLPDAHLRELASRSALWHKLDEDGSPNQVLPPVWAIAGLAARGTWLFPYLEAVTEAPALRADGSILDRPGYDELSGLLYEPNAEYPAVLDCPTKEQARAALDVLLEPFSEFCFVAASDRAATAAAILTVIGRHAIPGPTPMCAVLAHAPGTGKGLLVSAVTLIATGRLPTLMAPTHESEELRKVITTIAMEGHRAVLLDNAEGRFGSPVLAAALTATEWSGRVLGFSRTVTAPLHAVWFVTGNNISFVGDTYRRIIPILLDAQVERPEDRVFKHPELLSYISANRPRLYVAGLTVLKAFIAAGRPTHGGPRLGSFETWDDLVRSAVIWLTEVDPCEGRSRIREEDDADRELMRQLFAAWSAAYPAGAAATVRDAMRRAEPDGDLHRALASLDPRGDGTKLEPRAIGYGLRKFRGRIVGGLRLERAETAKSGVLWRVVSVQPQPPAGGDDGDDGDHSGQSEIGGTEGTPDLPQTGPPDGSREGERGQDDHRHHHQDGQPENGNGGNHHRHHRHHHQADPSEAGGSAGDPGSSVDRIIEEEM